MRGCLPLELLDKRADAQHRRAGLLTFKGWWDRGRCVTKGEKAAEFNSHGKALFYEKQTEVRLRGGPDPDWDDDFDLFDGDPWSLFG